MPNDQQMRDEMREAFNKWFSPAAHNERALGVLGLRGIMWSAFQVGYIAAAPILSTRPQPAVSEAQIERAAAALDPVAWDKQRLEQYGTWHFGEHVERRDRSYHQARAALTAALATPPSPWMPSHRHVKSGGDYEVMNDDAWLECATPATKGDGRFQPLPPAPKGGDDAE
jgi:hypothetical protein